MASSFWEFSLSFYAREGVAPACIVLQDEGGVDVNLMLYLLFLGESRLVAERRDVEALDAAVAPWREDVVRSLRGLRRRLKDEVGAIAREAREAFRNQIKKVELESERVQQLTLERAGKALQLGTVASREMAAERNLAAYSAFLGGLPENPVKTILDIFTHSPPS